MFTLHDIEFERCWKWLEKFIRSKAIREAIPSNFPSRSSVVSSFSGFCSGSFGEPKKSPAHSTRSNLPCFASIAFTLVNKSRIEPDVDPTVNLFALFR